MSVSFVAASATWVSANGNPAIPSGTAAGDRMFLFSAAKPYNSTFGALTGWTRLDAACGSNGTTASSVDDGSVVWEVWWRDWQSGDAAPDVVWAGINTAGSVIHTVRKTLDNFDIASAKGSDTTSGTDFSLTMDADPGITSGDVLLGFSVLAGNDANLGSAPVISATSATIGAATELPATELTTNVGDDLAASACHAACTAGTGSANPVLAWTLSNSQTGGGVLIRVRDAAAASGNPYYAYAQQ